jgi:hypothetical protein
LAILKKLVSALVVFCNPDSRTVLFSNPAATLASSALGPSNNIAAEKAAEQRRSLENLKR